MKTLPQMLVDARVLDVFQRVPLLDAFSLDDELCLCDLEVRPLPGGEWGDPVYREIGAAIEVFIVEIEQAGANELLRRRTFARALH